MADFASVQRRFSNHLRDPQRQSPPSHLEDRRLQIYRDLIFKNVEGFISSGFPILRSLYSEDHWLQLVRDFISTHRCHSPYFLEISEEFLSYLREERVMQPSDPAFILELSHYEWVELALDVSTEEFPGQRKPTADLLSEVPLVSPLAWILSYQYPVHLLGPDFQPQAPPDEPTFLIVYRNRYDQVNFMASNAASARLLNLLESDTSLTGEAALRQLAQEIQHPDVAGLLDMGRGLLQTFQDHDILI